MKKTLTGFLIGLLFAVATLTWAETYVYTGTGYFSLVRNVSFYLILPIGNWYCGVKTGNEMWEYNVEAVSTSTHIAHASFNCKIITVHGQTYEGLSQWSKTNY